MRCISIYMAEYEGSKELASGGRAANVGASKDVYATEDEEEVMPDLELSPPSSDDEEDASPSPSALITTTPDRTRGRIDKAEDGSCEEGSIARQQETEMQLPNDFQAVIKALDIFAALFAI